MRSGYCGPRSISKSPMVAISVKGWAESCLSSGAIMDCAEATGARDEPTGAGGPGAGQLSDARGSGRTTDVGGEAHRRGDPSSTPDACEAAGRCVLGALVQVVVPPISPAIDRGGIVGESIRLIGTGGTKRGSSRGQGFEGGRKPAPHWFECNRRRFAATLGGSACPQGSDRGKAPAPRTIAIARCSGESAWSGRWATSRHRGRCG